MDPIESNPNPEPIVPSQTPPGMPLENPNSEPQMRTFSNDLVEELRKHQGAAMKIAMMENEKKLKDQAILSNDPRQNMSFIVKGIIVVIAGIAIASTFFYYYKKNTTLPVSEIVKNPPSIVRSEELSTLNVSNMSASDIAVALSGAVSKSNVPTGMIGNIYITQGLSGSETRLTASMFLSALNTHTTVEFLHALTQEYMVGEYSYSGSNLFIVLRGAQHDAMLAGMLQWEPYLLTDLAPVFDVNVSGDRAYLLDNPVTEVLIENHDTRAVLDSLKKPVIFYSFLDENTVLIAIDPKTLTEAVRRMAN